jgi:lysophospholipase L1-like esterase
MRRTIVASAAILATAFLAQPARAGTKTLLAIGDSVAFGETTFTANPSNGDRGFVADYANNMASMAGGSRPIVTNLAIDGETSSSFLTGSGRVLSVPGTTDSTVQSWNTNYASNPSITQNQAFQQAITAAKAAGNDVATVTISLGANDLFKLVANPAFQSGTPAVQQQMLNSTLNQIGSTYAVLLAEVHTLAPNAKVFAVGTYNPFPADPTNPLNAFAKQAILGLDATVKSVAGSWGATYVDTYTPFLGNEAKYTYMNVVPGDVHPNAIGYQAISDAIAGASAIATANAVPEPTTFAVLGLGFAGLVAGARRRSRRAVA